jgi:hypothetical protein
MQWTAQTAGGPQYLHFLYASGERRPCRLTVNGRTLPEEVLGAVTGGFFPEQLVWKTYGPFAMNPGANTVRIAADGHMPHLKGLVVSPDAQPPSRQAFPLSPEEEEAHRPPFNLAGLRAAIVYLKDTYGADYPQGDVCLARLDGLEHDVRREDNRRLSAEEWTTLNARVEVLRREALLAANPLLRCGRLLFVRRYTYQSNHYYTDYINGCEHFGGNLCVLSLADGRVTELAPQLTGGIFGRYDLSFDGRRVVFDYKAKIGEGFRIWEVGVEGTNLRQITFPPPDEAARIAKYKINERYQHHTDDLHPCYLPDGGICFVSTRCERGVLCDGPDLFTTTALYRMDADGRNLRVLSQTPLSEASPSVTNDGRILYTRWEYVDKADVVIKCLWAMRPDGTGSAEVFGNDITFPDTLLHGRAVPGHHNLFAVIGAPHMPLGVGTVIRLDINHSIRTRRPMTYLTPDIDILQEYGYHRRRGGTWVATLTGPLYTDVQPLSDRFYLVSCNPDQPYNDVRAWGLYLLDEFGNRVRIYQDPEMSAWQPQPLRPRPRPPTLPATGSFEVARSRIRENSGAFREGPAPPQPPNSHEFGYSPDEAPAVLALSDVYQGLGSVPRGTIKYLRVLETVPRPWAARRFWDGDCAYQQHAVVSMNASLHVKRLHGVVPVEADGSAHFVVPPNKNLFLQALDEDFLEVQRMRTFINLQPNETRACLGCHAERHWTPANTTPVALRRPPSVLQPQPGDTSPGRPLHYITDVQPILDRHCVRCHNPDQPDGQLDLSGTLTTLFNRSYENLLSKDKDLVQVVHENDPKTGDAASVPPYTLGAHASRLVKLLRQRHEDVCLTREEFIRLVTWIDSNSAYYGTYFGRRNLKYRHEPDFRPLPSKELEGESAWQAGGKR